MKRYFITPEQYNCIQGAICDAKVYNESYDDFDAAAKLNSLSREIMFQCAETEHYHMDDNDVNEMSVALFRIGAWLDRLNATLSVYAEHDAKEVLSEIRNYHTQLENILKTKV